MRETVVEANAPMVSAMYDMAKMIVQAIENNAVEISGNSKGIFSAVKKEAAEISQSHWCGCVLR